MERIVGVEQARGKLGPLAEEVAGGGEPIAFAKRGDVLAVLISRQEYERLKLAASRLARAELQDRLVEIRESVKKAGLDPSVVDEAITAARHVH